jgi:hypothetical protein
MEIILLFVILANQKPSLHITVFVDLNHRKQIHISLRAYFSTFAPLPRKDE